MRGNTFCNQIAGVSKMLSRCKVSELERPKTELDLPTVRIDSPRSGPKSTGEFPIITNDLKSKRKHLVNKKKKVKHGFEKSRKAEKDKVDGHVIGAASKAFSAEEGDLQEIKKDVAHMFISGSLNDLCRKGLYLKDLVDSQKKKIDDNEYDDDVDDEEDIHFEQEKEGESEEQESEDEDDDVDDDDKENEDTEHSDDSSHFIMGEETDSDRETECGKSEKDQVCEVNDTGHTTADESKAEKSVEASRIEIEANRSEIQRTEDKTDESKNMFICAKEDRTYEEFEHCEATGIPCKEMAEVVTVSTVQKYSESKGSADAMAVTSNIACIVPYEASARDTRLESIKQKVRQDNLNQTTNAKSSDKTHSKEKSRGQFLKASVVTMVSQPVLSSSQSKSILPPESRTSQSNTQSTGSGGSQATDSQFVTKSSTGAC